MLTRFYESLLSSSRGRGGRILTCGVIGGIVILTLLFNRDPASWHWMLMSGMVLGMLAGVLLTGLDGLRNRRIAATPGTSRRRRPDTWWLAAMAVALATIGVIGGMVWTIVSRR